MSDSATQSAEGWKVMIQRLVLRHPKWLLVIFSLAALAPFLSKPFNMDDPLFVWAAKQIRAHPGNPYGFDVNWYGTVMPMPEVTMNPPLASYYLALAGSIVGWSEVALHAVFLLPACAVVLGTYRLAKHFCGRPLFAALMTLFTPAFLVSATTVMCDVLMLALWIWAMVFWVEGIPDDSAWRLVISGSLIGAAVLAKYYAVCLIPLLGAYGLLVRRRLGWWLGCLLVPLLVLCLYHFAMHRLYGRVLLADAAGYAKLPGSASQLFVLKAGSVLAALTFTGGCLAVVTFLLPLVCRARLLMAGALIAVVLILGLLFGSGVLKSYGPIQGSSKLFIGLQLVFWSVGGVGILTLAVTDLQSHRDEKTWLLFLWLIGTFFFAGLVNWTVNGRTILPMAPVAAILLARCLERNTVETGKLWPRGALACVAAGAGLAFVAARADFQFALAAREAAQVTHEKYGQGESRFWFQGHWGFQYYLEALGAFALDMNRTVLKRGDIIATPENSTNFSPLGPDLVVLHEILTVPGPQWVAAMRGEVGAGFYAASRGPLPFAFGSVPPERIIVCRVDPTTPPQQPSQGRQ